MRLVKTQKLGKISRGPEIATRVHIFTADNPRIKDELDTPDFFICVRIYYINEYIGKGKVTN